MEGVDSSHPGFNVIKLALERPRIATVSALDMFEKLGGPSQEVVSSINVQAFLNAHSLFKRKVKGEARKQALCPGAEGVVLGGAAGGAIGSVSVKMGLVGGAVGGPPGAVVGVCVGVLSGLVAGTITYRLAYERHKAEGIERFARNDHYLTWKAEKENEQVRLLLNRLDMLIIRVGTIPVELTCSITGRVIRSACALGSTNTFDLSVLENLVPNKKGQFPIGDDMVTENDVGKNLWTDLVERDVYRYRHRFLATLLERTRSEDLSVEQVEELNRVISHCKTVEENTRSRVAMTIAVEMKKADRQYDAAEIIGLTQRLAQASKNNDYYCMWDGGNTITDYLTASTTTSPRKISPRKLGSPRNS